MFKVVFYLRHAEENQRKENPAMMFVLEFQGTKRVAGAIAVKAKNPFSTGESPSEELLGPYAEIACTSFPQGAFSLQSCFSNSGACSLRVFKVME